MPEASPAAQRLTALLACECSVPNFNSLTPYRLNLLYLRLMQQGLGKYIFHGNPGISLSEFKHILLSPAIWTYAAFDKTSGEPLGFALLDRFEGASARLHFTFYRGEGMTRSREFARPFFDFIFENGSLASLTALTPALFRHSRRYALDLGFKELGVIPGACGPAGDGIFLVLDSQQYKQEVN